ncbi:hypothetical protein [Rhodococcus sp. 66b]|uniref:hypothetical protein n=1 Tax=Rhodococcus sp. 66b TaxID=1945511 RepID=UPI0009D46A88|nr:hypothetical protein [Rhodococcus sp. 66b]OQM82053.1 hypothetical protein B0E55_01678 [Rhodococcus sp. 66b]
MTGVDVEHTKALKERAHLGHLVAMTSGVRNGDHWYICDDNESVATISANDGIDEELRQPRAELFAYAVNTLPALVAAVERVQALHTPDEFGMCEGCGDNEHGYAIVPHPCPTIRALETP